MEAWLRVQSRASKSRGLQLFHEVMNAISWRSRREEFLHLNFQDFGEIEQRLVVDVGQPRFDV